MKPQPQNISLSRQARLVTSQAVAKAQSVKSAQSDQRSVQLRSSVQDQPVNQAQFPVLVSQGQGQRQDYAFKIDLQDAYFHVTIHPSSRKYLRFAFENKVYQFWVLPFGLNTAPQVFTRLVHGDRLSSPSGDLGDTISRRLVNSPSGPPSSTPTSAYKYTGPSRLYPKQKEI